MLGFVNLTQIIDSWAEGTSVEEISPTFTLRVYL